MIDNGYIHDDLYALCEGDGHVRRTDDGYIGRMMLRMELPGKRKREKHKRRFMDAVRGDMALVEVTEGDAEESNKWRSKIRHGYP